METTDIEGKTLHLAFPDEQKVPWIGDKEYISQIQSAWTHERDKNQKVHSLFNPKILGRCGMGKTTLAYSAANLFHQHSPSEVFILHSSNNLVPDQVLVYEVETERNTEYHASSLVTAMIKGGICVVDECQFLSPEVWAAITSLLDQRYITSDVVGLKIHAHENFRIVFTENFQGKRTKARIIPEYIGSLLKPVININHPKRKHEMDVLKFFFSDSNPKLLQHIVDFLQSAHFEERSYSVRDGINIIQRYQSITTQKDGEIDWDKLYQAIRQILDNQAIYFLNELQNQSKDADFLFKDEDTNFLEEDDKEDSGDINDFYEADENFAEFVEDDPLEEFDDSFLFLDDKDDSKTLQDPSSDSSDEKYLKNLRKKIRGKLKRKKENNTNK